MQAGSWCAIRGRVVIVCVVVRDVVLVWVWLWVVVVVVVLWVWVVGRRH